MYFGPKLGKVEQPFLLLELYHFDPNSLYRDLSLFKSSSSYEQGIKSNQSWSAEIFSVKSSDTGAQHKVIAHLDTKTHTHHCGHVNLQRRLVTVNVSYGPKLALL